MVGVGETALGGKICDVNKEKSISNSDQITADADYFNAIRKK